MTAANHGGTITQEYLKECLEYNPDTGEFVWKVRREELFPSRRICRSWNTRCAGKLAGSIKKGGYVHIGLLGKWVKAHRLAWLYVYGVFPDGVDHINHIKTDNRICNLRAADQALNNKNACKRKDNTSGVTGVYWDREASKWLAAIGLNGKTKTIGRYVAFEDAAAARKEAEIKAGFHPNHGRNPPGTIEPGRKLEWSEA